MTQGERIASLETEVRLLKEQMEANNQSQDKRHKEMNDKLDSLIALRNKGAGAFWLGTSLFGTTLIGFAYMIVHWFK